MDRFRPETRRASFADSFDVPAQAPEPPSRGILKWAQRMLEERTRDQEFELARLQERIRLLERTSGRGDASGELRSKVDELEGSIQTVVADLRKECAESVEQATTELQREQAEGLSRLRLEALRRVLQETMQVRRVADQARAEVEDLKAATARLETQIAVERREASARLEEFARQLEERSRQVAEDLERRFEERSLELSRKLEESAAAGARQPEPAPAATGTRPAAVEPRPPTPLRAAPLPERRGRCLWVQQPLEVAKALENKELLEERLLQMWVENRIEGVRDAWDHHRARLEEIHVTAPALAERLRSQIEKTSAEARTRSQAASERTAQEPERPRPSLPSEADLGEAVA